LHLKAGGSSRAFKDKRLKNGNQIKTASTRRKIVDSGEQNVYVDLLLTARLVLEDDIFVPSSLDRESGGVEKRVAEHDFFVA
jgi:hypothetical protein